MTQQGVPCSRRPLSFCLQGEGKTGTQRLAGATRAGEVDRGAQGEG